MLENDYLTAADDLIDTGLYRIDPRRHPELVPGINKDNPYWCTNWVFSPVRKKDGTWVLLDTYWSTFDGVHIAVTDKVIRAIQFIMDTKKYCDFGTNRKSVENYAETDVKRIACDSGGYTMPHYFVRIGAKESNQIKLQHLFERREDLQRELDRVCQEIRSIETAN